MTERYRGVILLVANSLLFLLVGYATNLWLARRLGPEHYGLYGIVVSLMTVVNIAQATGLPRSLSRQVSIHPRQADSILKTGLVLQILFGISLSAMVFLLAPLAAKVFHDPAAILALRLVACVFPAYGLFILYSEYYNGLHLFRRQTVIGVVYSLAKLVAIIGLALFWGLPGTVIGFAVAAIGGVMAGFHAPPTQTAFFPYRPLLFFSLPLIGFAVASNLQFSMDLFFVKALLQPKEAGYYAVNQTLSVIPFFVLNAFSQVIYPTVVRSVARDKTDETIRLVRSFSFFLWLALAPIVALISAQSRGILTFLYTEQYATGSRSLSLLVVGIGCMTIFHFAATVISSTGRPAWSWWISFLGLAVTSFLCWLLIPSYGILGASLATTVGSFIIMVISLWTILRLFPDSVAWGRICASGLLALGVGWVVSLIEVPVLWLPIVLLVALGVYFGCLLFSGVIRRKELGSIVQVFRKRQPGQVPL